MADRLTPAQRAGAPGRGEPGDVAAWIVAGKPRWWHENPPRRRRRSTRATARWWVHNLVAHPLLVVWPRVGERLHDATAPLESAEVCGQWSGYHDDGDPMVCERPAGHRGRHRHPDVGEWSGDGGADFDDTPSCGGPEFCVDDLCRGEDEGIYGWPHPHTVGVPCSDRSCWECRSDEDLTGEG